MMGDFGVGFSRGRGGGFCCVWWMGEEKGRGGEVVE